MQNTRLCQKPDARIRMPDFLHAGGERHRHQPEQRNQSDEREGRLPNIGRDSVPLSQKLKWDGNMPSLPNKNYQAPAVTLITCRPL